MDWLSGLTVGIVALGTGVCLWGYVSLKNERREILENARREILENARREILAAVERINAAKTLWFPVIWKCSVDWCSADAIGRVECGKEAVYYCDQHTVWASIQRKRYLTGTPS